MLNVQTYIQENGIEALETELGIKVKYFDDLVLLDYSQIDSPKTHPVVLECRGLILNASTYEVVCRSFDRFFNLNECPDLTAFDFENATIVEKADGSLIRVYNHNSQWHIATRGTAFAETPVGTFDISFRELFLRTIGLNEDEFQEYFNHYCDTDLTYVFELCTNENRIVVTYDGDVLKYLAARNKITGEFVNGNPFGILSSVTRPERYTFENMEEFLDYASRIERYENKILEGFVVYQDMIPVCKLKSPTYVALHHMRTGDRNLKNALQLILSNEHDEYLSYFPSDREWVYSALHAINLHMISMDLVWEKYSMITDRKEFALNVKDSKYAPILFKSFQNQSSTLDEFNKLDDAIKIRYILKWQED